MSWANAKTYCEMGANGTLSGTGWRLPTMKELQTIVDDQKTNPAIDLMTFPGTSSAPFWTSSPFAGSPSGAWYVEFSSGSTYFQSDMTVTLKVRCVR